MAITGTRPSSGNTSKGWKSLFSAIVRANAGESGDLEGGQVKEVKPGDVDYTDNSFNSKYQLRFEPKRSGMFGFGTNAADSNLANKLNLEQVLTGQKLDLAEQTKIADEERQLVNSTREFIAKNQLGDPNDQTLVTTIQQVYGPEILASMRAATAANTTKAVNEKGIATRAEDIGSLTHPNIRATADVESQNQLGLARGRLGRLPLTNRALDFEQVAKPIAQEQDLYRGQFQPLSPGMSYDIRDYNTGNNKLLSIPPNRDPLEAEMLGLPQSKPTIKASPLDSSAITLSDGTVIPRKASGGSGMSSPVDNLLGRSFPKQFSSGAADPLTFLSTDSGPTSKMGSFGGNSFKLPTAIPTTSTQPTQSPSIGKPLIDPFKMQGLERDLGEILGPNWKSILKTYVPFGPYFQD